MNASANYDARETSLRDDLVGVDVGPVEGDGAAGVVGEGFHNSAIQ
jgi:hypothetical protein